MAATATDIWEFRATAGDANAGGGFNTAASGTDYSNQDSAQLQLTDLATSGVGVTTLTSATGGFTAAMIGNYIQIRSGTNVNAGFYRVTARTDTNTVTLDRAPDDAVGGVSSGNGDLGGALDIILDAFIDDADIIIAGNTIHIKNDGTMTLTGGGVTTSKDGTGLAPIIIDGYNSSRGDNPTGSNRPVIAMAANNFSFDNFWQVKNLIFTNTNSTGMGVDNDGMVINCKATNSSGSAGREAMNVLQRTKVIKTELISTNGAGSKPNQNSIFYGCYFHDSDVGLQPAVGNSTAINCVFDTMATAGFRGAVNVFAGVAINCTFYNCGTGIDMASTGNTSWAILNNVFDANTTGVDWQEADLSVYMDYNVWDNTTDVNNLVKGSNSVTGDPGLTDPANGDFTLGGGSNAIDAGLDATDAGATV